MLTMNKNFQNEFLLLTLEDIVPQNSIYRKIDKYIDFDFIYDEVKPLYCDNNGRPSIDPVVLFKLIFIQTIDGIKSLRKTCEKIKVDAEYRWFLKIPFGQDTPHFSTFGKNYERRFKGTDIFEKIFQNILNQAIEYNLVSGTTLFTDSTHKKANANKNKYHKEVLTEVKKRREWLEQEINEERKKQGKKEFEYNDIVESKEINVSDTDPESGYYCRSQKEKGFMYLDHRTVDGKCNLIVDCFVTKGNVHDSKPYIDRLQHIKNTFNFNIKACALDSGYDTLDIKKFFLDNNILGVIGYRRYGTTESRNKRRDFKYIKDSDFYVSITTGEILEYTGKIDRLGYKTYATLDKTITLTRHISQEINDKFRENRLSEEGKALYKRRKETVERSFADSKQNHGYRYAMYKGVEKNQNYTWLICSAQNMKNIVTNITRRLKMSSNITCLSSILLNFSYFFKNLMNFKII